MCAGDLFLHFRAWKRPDCLAHDSPLSSLSPPAKQKIRRDTFHKCQTLLICNHTKKNKAFYFRVDMCSMNTLAWNKNPLFFFPPTLTEFKERRFCMYREAVIHCCICDTIVKHQQHTIKRFRLGVDGNPEHTVRLLSVFRFFLFVFFNSKNL